MFVQNLPETNQLGGNKSEVFARSMFFSQTEICGQQEIEGSSTR